MTIPGGHSGAKPITPEMREKALTIKDLAETKLGETFDTFEPVEYRTQVVAGTIYHFKIRVSDSESVQVRVFEPLPYTNNPMEIMKIKKAPTGDELKIM